MRTHEKKYSASHSQWILFDLKYRDSVLTLEIPATIEIDLFGCPETFSHILQPSSAEFSELSLGFFVSLSKHSLITFQHILIEVVWKNTRLLLLSLEEVSDGHFLANRGSFQKACVLIDCSAKARKPKGWFTTQEEKSCSFSFSNNFIHGRTTQKKENWQIETII